MKRLGRKCMSALPLAFGCAVMLGLVLQLEYLVLERVENTELSVRLVSESPLADTQSLDAISLDLDETDLAAVQQRVLDLPWVRDAALRRIWPNRLQLELRPRQPIARWDDERLLSLQGVLVSVESPANFDHLPQVQAPEQDAAEVAGQFIWLQSRLDTLDIGIASLVREQWGALSIHTDRKQKIELGSSDFDERLKRLESLVRSGMADPTQVSYIDLRYEGMLAVGERKEGARP